MKKKRQKQKHTDSISIRFSEDQPMNICPKAERFVMEDGRCSCGGYIHHYIKKNGQPEAKCGWCGTCF